MKARKQQLAIDQSLYPISTVAELTGIKPITLRAWERRYDLITPGRSVKGRRLYSATEVEKIKAVKELLDEGIAISRAVEAINQNQDITLQQGSHQDVWQQHIETISKAISDFNEQALDDAYHEITALYPIDMVTQKLIMPLLHLLGEQWQSREGSVVEEHFFSTYLRNKLGARFHHQNRLNQGSLIIIAGLPGDHHEFGLLLFALTVMNRGMRVLILGPNLPLTELLHAVNKVNAIAIVLSGSHQADIHPLIAKLKQLQAQLDIPVFVGGNVAETYKENFFACGVHPVGADLSAGIDTILNFVESQPTQGIK